MKRRIAMYFAWDRSAEGNAPLAELDNRFPALFEVRRLFWPAYEALSHSPGGQGINDFLEAIFFKNFTRFGERVSALTGREIRQIQRQTDDALEVLARQVVDPQAPAHPVMPGGGDFDAILQSRPEAGLGRLVVCDATLWTSVFGGLDGLEIFWKNVIGA
jgi:hypothetical protein